MSLRRVLAVCIPALALSTALSACREDQISTTQIQPMRFQFLSTSSEVLMLDGATGDVWKLEEDVDSGTWHHYAKAPGDVRGIDQEAILRPPALPEGGEEGEEHSQEEEHHDDEDQPQDDGGDE